MNPPLRIGIDLFALVPGAGRGGGFPRYAVELLAALAGLEDDHSYFLFVNRLNASSFPVGRRFRHVVVPLSPRRGLWPLRLAWLHGLLPTLARRHRLDVVHFPFDTASFALPCPFVVTTMDLITDVYYPARFPGVVSTAKARYLFFAKRRAARRARIVICPSRATAEQAVRHYGVAPDRVRVIPLAADRFHRTPSDGAPAPEAATPPYVLSVTSLSPHKNIGTLIEAFRRARERFGVPHELHLAGMPGTGAEIVQRQLGSVATAGVPVRYLGYLDEPALAREYAGAAAFIFLPLVEGFGLPPLEAMAAGVPVVASRIDSLLEVCGDAAWWVPPDDPDAAATALGTVLTDPAAASRLAQAGQARARLFSWRETARRTREAYEAATASP